MTKRKLKKPILITIRVAIKKVVKVKAYVRLVNGKTQRVRSYYRAS